VPLLVNFLGLLLVRLPLAVGLAWPAVSLPAGLGTLAGMGLGAVGAWYAMAADLSVRGVAMLIVFSTPQWSRERV
jgi:Na+-driven multidrug efflux pump